MQPMKFNVKEIITRSPRLETLVMVEQFIKENSGEYKKTSLFHNLPKQLMWGTFNVIIDNVSKTLFQSSNDNHGKRPIFI